MPTNPSPLAEARAFRAQQQAGLRQGEIALRAGVRRPYVNKRLALLNLDAAAAHTIEQAGLGFAHLYALCRVADAKAQRVLAGLTVARGLSVRELERAVERARAGLPSSSRQWSGAHPDALALAKSLEDRIGRAVGVPISVRVLPGHRFEFRYVSESATQARIVAAQLGARLGDVRDL